MKYYHVSTSLDLIKEFVPRIPESLHESGEDAKIPRICVSEDLNGCFTAMPFGGAGIEDHIRETSFGYYRIYEIEVNENLISEYVIDSETLYTEELVSDANHTKECWITTPVSWDSKDISIKNSYIIRLNPNDIEEGTKKIISHSVRTDAEEFGLTPEEFLDTEFKEITTIEIYDMDTEELPAKQELHFEKMNLWTSELLDEAVPSFKEFKALATSLGLFSEDWEGDPLVLSSKEHINVEKLFEMDYKRRNSITELRQVTK
ncbi:hypothetical protein NSQ43_15450 [Sporosarcina sp. FSL W8-0480]|uniref:hypothetical protein n=1 Tax=Sporosarcina sp. FSL W8-0480 TaxID=2954701 RepID=UPI0030DB9C6F